MNAKQILFAVSAGLVTLAACQKDVIPSVSINEDSATVTAEENNLTVKLESNVALTPVTDADWVEVKVENGTLSINVEENYGGERAANISLVYNSETEATFKLTQSAGATDEIAEVEAFYYGHLDAYGAGTQNWMISFYNKNYIDGQDSKKFTYTFDLMASSEFTFVSGKFPTGTFTLNPVSEIGAIYGVNSSVTDNSTWNSINFNEATITIESTDVADEYAIYVKGTTAKTENAEAESFKFAFKAVCGDTGDYDLRKYDTRVSSDIKKDYDITFAESTASCDSYEDGGTVFKWISLTLTKGNPAMGDNPAADNFTYAEFILDVASTGDDYSGTYNLDPDVTGEPFTIEYDRKSWQFFGAYVDSSDEYWYRPLNHSHLYPSSGSMTLTKLSDGKYKVEGSFLDDYTDDYPEGNHTVTIHAQFELPSDK